MKGLTYFRAKILVVIILVLSAAGTWKIPLEIQPQEARSRNLYLQAGFAEKMDAGNAELLVARAVEGALATVAGVSDIRTTVRDSGVGASLKVDGNADLDLKTIQISEAILPLARGGIIHPSKIQVYAFNPEASPVIRLGVSDRGGQLNLAHQMQTRIRIAFEGLPAVSKVEVLGAEPPIEVHTIETAKMLASGLPTLRWLGRFRPFQFQEPLGFGTRIEARTESLDQFLSFPLTPGRHTRILDVAQRDREREKTGIFRVQGAKAAVIELFQREGANPFDLETQVADKVQELSLDRAFRDQIHFEWIQNGVESLRSGINDVVSSLFQSVLITFFVIMFFLLDLKRTGLISVTIPITLLLTVALLYCAGKTLSVVAMAGLILGIGMVVDNVILVVDKFYEQIQTGATAARAAGEAARGCFEALWMASLTNALIFVPVLFTDSEDSFVGILRGFQPSILATLVASLVVALLVVPVGLQFFAPKLLSGRASSEGRQFKETSRNIARFFFDHRNAAMAVTIGLCLLIFRFADTLEAVDLEEPVEASVSIEYEIESARSAQAREASWLGFESRLLAAQRGWGVHSISSQWSPSGTRATFRLVPNPASDGEIAKRHLTANVRKLLHARSLPVGERITVEALPGEESRSEVAGSRRGPTRRIELYGPSYSGATEILSRLRARIVRVPGVRRVLDDRQLSGAREWQIEVGSDRLARYGLDAGTLAAQISAMKGELGISGLRRDGQEVGLALQWVSSSGAWTLDKVVALPIQLPDGGRTTLGALGKIVEVGKLHGIRRSNGKSRAELLIEYAGEAKPGLLAQARSQVESQIAAVVPPPGFRFGSRGLAESLAGMQQNMAFMILLGSFLIYLFLGVSYNSAVLPAIVLVSIPFAVLSGLAGLLITGMPLDVMARLGLVILVGIGVNNSILFLDVIGELRRKGLSPEMAVIEGCSDRLRAVFMTTGIQVIGVLPVALGNAKIMGIPYASLGVCIMSGMILSTLMTLSVFPALVYGYYRRQGRTAYLDAASPSGDRGSQVGLEVSGARSSPI